MGNTLYGLKACDSCRKAMRWLAEQGITVSLHDLREDGLQDQLLETWLDEFGIDALLNRRSTTWRSLEASEREPINLAGARQLLRDHPTLIKRPVLSLNGQWILGYSEAKYATLLAGSD